MSMMSAPLKKSIVTVVIPEFDTINSKLGTPGDRLGIYVKRLTLGVLLSAGVKKGMQLLRINDTDVSGYTYKQAKPLLKDTAEKILVFGKIKQDKQINSVVSQNKTKEQIKTQKRKMKETNLRKQQFVQPQTEKRKKVNTLKDKKLKTTAKPQRENSIVTVVIPEFDTINSKLGTPDDKMGIYVKRLTLGVLLSAGVKKGMQLLRINDTDVSSYTYKHAKPLLKDTAEKILVFGKIKQDKQINSVVSQNKTKEQIETQKRKMKEMSKKMEEMRLKKEKILKVKFEQHQKEMNLRKQQLVQQLKEKRNKTNEISPIVTKKESIVNKRMKELLLRRQQVIQQLEEKRKRVNEAKDKKRNTAKEKIFDLTPKKTVENILTQFSRKNQNLPKINEKGDKLVSLLDFTTHKFGTEKDFKDFDVDGTGAISLNAFRTAQAHDLIDLKRKVSRVYKTVHEAVTKLQSIQRGHLIRKSAEDESADLFKRKREAYRMGLGMLGYWCEGNEDLGGPHERGQYLLVILENLLNFSEDAFRQSENISIYMILSDQLMNSNKESNHDRIRHIIRQHLSTKCSSKSTDNLQYIKIPVKKLRESDSFRIRKEYIFHFGKKIRNTELVLGIVDDSAEVPIISGTYSVKVGGFNSICSAGLKSIDLEDSGKFIAMLEFAWTRVNEVKKFSNAKIKGLTSIAAGMKMKQKLKQIRLREARKMKNKLEKNAKLLKNAEEKGKFVTMYR